MPDQLSARASHGPVPELCQNPSSLTDLGLLLSEKQIPQVVVNIKNGRTMNGTFGSHPAPLGAGGRAFKSPRPDQYIQYLAATATHPEGWVLIL
jgi:hypothetical protein